MLCPTNIGRFGPKGEIAPARLDGRRIRSV